MNETRTGNARLIRGDCLEVLPTLPDASVDAVITDPPAGIGFMGKAWDKFEAPGGSHISERLPTVTVGGTPNRNPICRLCGKRERGEPKRGPCGCAAPDFDTQEWRVKGRAAFVAFLTAALAECLRVAKPGARLLCWAIPRTSHWTGTAVEDAGWVIEDRISHLFGTGFPKARSKLKPACEDWWLARKPSRGVSPLQIDACRVGTEDKTARRCAGGFGPNFSDDNWQPPAAALNGGNPAGRWPANLCLSHHEDCDGECHHDCPVRLLDEQSGERGDFAPGHKRKRQDAPTTANAYGDYQRRSTVAHFDSGGASRFFYCAKASRKDRGEGNTHPTVKNTALMRWLCRLITPPGGVVLDPFMGSGSTGVAALAEGLGFVGVEKDPAYFAVAEKRLREAAA